MLDADARYGSGLVQGPSRDPWLTSPVTYSMDYYTADSRVLQEMLAVDMGSEIDCGVNEGKSDYDFNGADGHSLEMDDDPIGMFGRSILNANSNSSNSNFNLDLSGSDVASIMVNPNCVMPIAIRNPSSNIDKRPFFFPSKIPCEEKIDVEEEDEVEEEEEEVENEEDSHTENENENDNENEAENENDISETEEESEDEDEEEISEQVSAREPETITISAPKASATQFIKAHTMQKINGTHGIRFENIRLVQSASQASQHLRKQIYNNNLHIGTGATAVVTAKKKDIDSSDSDKRSYLKPPFSYSCLIAMALKNSPTGCLPVSEIYNFLNTYFPYFRSAPNGWKNSVRHNLSLNKCFEKIEKPAGNGNQRKGCLWAINPERAAKMDDEIQKCSRKDPEATRRAMRFPDCLEKLVKGQMKHGSSVVSEESSSDETAEENRTYEESINDHIAANSVTDSFDESSKECDVDVHDNLYEHLAIDDNSESLRMQLSISKQESFDYQLTSPPKRQKTLTGTIQGNYVYQPVTTSRRKTPLFVRAGTGNNSFLQID